MRRPLPSLLSVSSSMGEGLFVFIVLGWKGDMNLFALNMDLFYVKIQILHKCGVLHCPEFCLQDFSLKTSVDLSL